VLAELASAGWEEREAENRIVFVVYGDGGVAVDLERAFGEVTSEEVAPGWEQRWREFHQPVTLGPWWIGPPWARPLPSPGTRIVVIDPGRAFGTGAHPTTRMCLELLLTRPPCSLVDLGCGSGVLAIAAGVIGFRPIVAIDSDEAAVEETRRNARENGVVLEARRADVCSDALPFAELALANLERALIVPVAERFAGPQLIASGYLVEDEIQPPGWLRVERRESGGWAADLFVRI